MNPVSYPDDESKYQSVQASDEACQVLYYACASSQGDSGFIANAALVLRDVGPKLQPTGSSEVYNPFSRLFHLKSLMDDGLLSALLFHAAVHMDLVKGQIRSPTMLHYRGETLKHLRLRLESSTNAVSDATIVMVAFIAATGVSGITKRPTMPVLQAAERE